MIEMMADSNSSFSKLHEVVDDTSNSYKSMMIDVMIMNQGCGSECSSIDEEPNVDTTRFFELLKDSNEP
jgi:hypothetical protein